MDSTSLTTAPRVRGWRMKMNKHKPGKKSAASIIAATFGWDRSEPKDYCYQRYSAPEVYAVGDKYFAVFSQAPRHAVGGEWKPHLDQFWAAPEGTTLWVCAAIDKAIGVQS